MTQNDITEIKKERKNKKKGNDIIKKIAIKHEYIHAMYSFDENQNCMYTVLVGYSYVHINIQIYISH